MASQNKLQRTYDPESGLGENHARGEAGSRYRDEIDFDDGFDVEPVAKAAAVAASEPPPTPLAQPPVLRVVTEDSQPPTPLPQPAIEQQPSVAEKSVDVTKAVVPIPGYLTWESVASGSMPAFGDSGLPASLEQDVPPAYRYWKCDDVKTARVVRDALVESGMFGEGSIVYVDGEPRRVIEEVVKRVWLAGPYDDAAPVEVPTPVSPIAKVAGMVSDADPAPTLLVDTSHVKAFGIDHVMAMVRKFEGDWLVAAEDSESVRKAMGPCFRLRVGGEGVVFATSAKLEPGSAIESLVDDRSTQVLKNTVLNDAHEIRVLKGKEERIIFGVVLEPDTVDSQNDTVPPEEIRQAAHKFMEDFGNLGLQHKEIVNGKLKLLESFIAPVDFEADGQPVKKGTWLMAQRVVDDSLWKAIRKGEITGYSIGGSAIRRKS